jgi:alkylation response protein AidB-like acyl-CoA dehydrogenase
MDFTLTETQRELKVAARRYLSDRYPPERIAELADTTGYDADAWPELDRQGWLDPDLGPVELTLLAEESGRALHPVPWWATVALALPVYEAAGVPLPGPATFADAGTDCRAYRDGDDWRIDGVATDVVDAYAADEVVVAAGTPDGVALFGVRGGLRLAASTGIDPLRVPATLDLAGTPARLLVDPTGTGALLAAIDRRTVVLLAAEAVGVADRALEMAVAYARTRIQFGRPIGSYQAVAHQLADAYADLELARSLAYRAAVLLADPSPEASDAVDCAAYTCAPAAVGVCETAIQVTGGMGVTWEYPLHRWYRRALWLQGFHATRPDPLVAVAAQLLDPLPR